jgi:metal-responsive CopG/Arc/MetJ family transcriptional regulator
MNARKLSASLPGDQFKEVERTRKKLGMGRSEIVQEALSLWLSARQRDERVTRYLAGYVNQPEDGREALALVNAWAAGMLPEDW